jgi:pyrimidine-specific ribonucleoside hydrolase
MKRILVVFSFALVITVSLLSCTRNLGKETKRNIILDVDMSVDDMMAILYFLSCSDVDIKAITIENGVSTVDSGAEIVLRMLHLTGHPEIPVAKGNRIPLEGDNTFPEQWRPAIDRPFGLELPPHNLMVTKTGAADLIAQLAEKYKDNLTILAMGPLTNIAQVFLNDPGLVKNISQVYVSDGAVNVEGGIYKEWPEINNHVSGWNLWLDARAAGTVFNSGVPVVLVPLDLTALHGRDPLVLTSGFIKRYRMQATGTTGKAMATLMNKWLVSYVYDEQSERTSKAVPIWDLVAALIFHHPEIGTVWKERRVDIQEGTDEVAGQIITLNYGTPNVRICFKGNQTLLDSLLLRTARK